MLWMDLSSIVSHCNGATRISYHILEENGFSMCELLLITMNYRPDNDLVKAAMCENIALAGEGARCCVAGNGVMGVSCKYEYDNGSSLRVIPRAHP